MMLVRKRKVQNKVVRLRKIHYRNLVVKAFSSILFHAQTSVKCRGLERRRRQFIKDKFLSLWRRAYDRSRDNAVKVFHQ